MATKIYTLAGNPRRDQFIDSCVKKTGAPSAPRFFYALVETVRANPAILEKVKEKVQEMYPRTGGEKDV